jgi:hypothetical protein
MLPRHLESSGTAGGPGPDDDVNPRRGCPRSLAFGDRGWKTRRGLLSRSVQALKLPVSMRSRERPFRQAHHYDFNVSAHVKFVEKLRYIHRNPGSPAHELCARGWKPVRRGLVEAPEDSRHLNDEDPSPGTPVKWSSVHHYRTGMRGIVEIESEWTAQRREAETVRLLCIPPFARKKAKSGAPTFEEG